MDGIKHSSLGKIRGFGSVLARSLVACIILFGAQTPAAAQGTLLPGLPGKNVNIIGPTPNPLHVREVALRQQNEPYCTIRPENHAFILCAYNDYRATDLPRIQGDSWIGLSMSPDFGKTWFSRLAPGFKASDTSLGYQFAADPNVVSVPGNSPGFAILSYIAANRDLDDGVLAIQRLAVMPKEDVDFWVPENQIFTPDLTNNGRFADRPSILPIVDSPENQTIQTITMQLENGETVEREVVSGRLLICYSIFTGSNSSKIICKISFDWGATWTKDIKLSEEQVRVQGVVMSNIGNTIVAAWRRADTNKGLGNAIVTATSTDGGFTWTKGQEAAQLCPIDQGATGAQLRLIDIPSIANDGENFYVVTSDRRFAGDGTCATGIPKAVMTWSSNGRQWSKFQPLDVGSENPFGEPSGSGFQYITEAVGFKNKVVALWYDTRRETPLPQPEPPEMRDFVATGGIVNRKADIYAVKIRADDSGQPQVSPAVRVSRYKTVLYNSSNGVPLPVPQEAEAHFPNAPIFEEGTRAFNGDYISAAVPRFRRQNADVDANGPWIQNTSSTGFDALDDEDVWITWGDTRDLRGNYLATEDDEDTSPFTPNNAVMAMLRDQLPQVDDPERELLAAGSDEQSKPEETGELTTLRSESVADEPAGFGLCEPANPQDRTRDANVYGSMLKSVTEFVALTPTKPLVGFQRTIPIVITNPDEVNERSFTLKIMNQPSDFDATVEHTGHASWKQLPSKPPLLPGAEADTILVSVPPKSSAARTLFLISSDTETSIAVNLYDGGCTPGADDCPALSTIVVGGGEDLIDSDYCLNNPSDTCKSVDSLETHDPSLLNPDLQSPDLQSARLLSPDLQSPDLQSPDLQSPDLQSLGFATPDLQSPDLQSPDLQSPDLQSPDLQSPDLQSPDLQSPDLQSASYVDVTYTIRSEGNVTTTYSADMAFTGLNPELISGQLIAYTAYITGTSRGCEYLPVFENQILASKNLTDEELRSITLPTVEDPFAGPISFASRPGQTVGITLRVFGPADQLKSLNEEQFIAATEFGLSAHACNDAANIDPKEDCLTVGVEKLFSDRSGPTFSGLQTGDVIPAPPIEADRIGGACIDLLGGTDPLVSAADPSGVADLTCTLISTGQQICSTGEPGLSIPVMSNPLDPSTAAQVSCTATDNAGNETIVEFGVAVADTTPPEISGTPTFTSVNADPLLGTALLALEEGLVAVDDPLVDPDPVISCTASGDGLSQPAITGEYIGPGEYDVSCIATDKYNNASVTPFTYTLTIIDVTPPTLADVPGNQTGIEATSPEGKVFTYDTPTATDTAGGATVSCEPASGSTFGLGTTTVICTATDDGGNTAEATFDVEIVDTTPPTIEAPDSDVSVAVDASGFGTLIFEDQVTVTDLVDADPLVECIATAGAGAGVSSGGPLPIGTTEVTCTATDDYDNEASASYTVLVEYGSSFGIEFSKGTVKAGSTAPSVFGWLDASGNRIDSSDANPLITAKNCATGEIVLNPGQYPGNSDLRWDPSALEWKFNWQTVFEDGTAIPGGITYCVQAISQKTGQRAPDDLINFPFGTPIKVRN